jgi:hypothetical protein
MRFIQIQGTAVIVGQDLQLPKQFYNMPVDISHDTLLGTMDRDLDQLPYYSASNLQISQIRLRLNFPVRLAQATSTQPLYFYRDGMEGSIFTSSYFNRGNNCGAINQTVFTRQNIATCSEFNLIYINDSDMACGLSFSCSQDQEDSEKFNYNIAIVNNLEKTFKERNVTCFFNSSAFKIGAAPSNHNLIEHQELGAQISKVLDSRELIQLIQYLIYEEKIAKTDFLNILKPISNNTLLSLKKILSLIPQPIVDALNLKEYNRFVTYLSNLKGQSQELDKFIGNMNQLGLKDQKLLKLLEVDVEQINYFISSQRFFLQANIDQILHHNFYIKSFISIAGIVLLISVACAAAFHLKIAFIMASVACLLLAIGVKTNNDNNKKLQAIDISFQRSVSPLIDKLVVKLKSDFSNYFISNSSPAIGPSPPVKPESKSIDDSNSTRVHSYMGNTPASNC